MSLQLKKAAPQELRSLGLDERWLQDQISNDPSLLGLGQLEVAGREHRQPVGGRIDFLMRHAESGEYYEVEIMLGKLDESHIIRTIEYWDLERQRRPKSKHRAVIVAEHITSRFFNVLRLLNRAVPMIAVQLSAFPVDGGVVLHPVTVLDVVEEADSDVVDEAEKADRAYWVKNSDSTFLLIVDKIISIFRAGGPEPRVAYNRGHIALGTEGYNFCWFYPRKLVGHCRIDFRATEETRDSLLSSLQAGGIDANPADTTEYIRFNITTDLLEEHFALISDVLKRAEELSRN
jgi:hypothetical protein